jgi:Rps23 Pro-64 3,4-dihydroxylase Tpa1-like proline 4-hydroxylase
MQKINFIELIVSRLTASMEDYKREFESSASAVGTRYFVVDELLPTHVATNLAKVFPSGKDMRRLNTFREKKYTSKNFELHDEDMLNITYAIQHKDVIALIEKITGFKEQIADPSLYAGGLSSMGYGDFLLPHIDNSHDGSLRNYRTLNLLYYVTPGWDHSHGGNLELWDKYCNKSITVDSFFNRLVVMETNRNSWHSVSMVKNANLVRNCVSNYYFSNHSPESSHYFHITKFSAPNSRPYLRLLLKVDGISRSLLRGLKPSGFSKHDVFEKLEKI